MSRSLPLARLLLLVSLPIVLRPGVARAAWPSDPLVNLPVCTTSDLQHDPASTSDQAGGAIVAWRDGRNHIYALHLLAGGAVDPAWPVNGRALDTIASDQQFPAIVSDGTGGAIVSWKDHRNGVDYDLYAQHVLASGAVDPAWPVDGIAVCTEVGDQDQVRMTPDGAGGAILVWQDQRSGDVDIYAHHVQANGIADPAWPVDGLPVCTAPFNQFSPVLIGDGAGGALISWYDLRSGNRDVYADHVLANGTTDLNWPSDGLALSTEPHDQSHEAIVSDGSSGAIVAWEDNRSGFDDIYAQHVLLNGTVDPGWPVDGAAVCTAADDQFDVALVADGAGGAVIGWEDFRTSNDEDIYAQHLRSNGAVDGGWPVNGVAVCTAPNDQYTPRMISDAAGGAIVTWFDFRTATDYDVYAQRVLAAGTVDPAWPANGRALTLAANDQDGPAIVGDAAGGAIVAWEDRRTDIAYDIYAQRVSSGGVLGGSGAATTVATLSCATGGGVCTETLSPVDGQGHPYVNATQGSWVSFEVDAGCSNSPCSGHCTLTPTGQPTGASWPAITGPISAGGGRAIGPFTTPGTYTYTMSCSPGIAGTIQVNTQASSVPAASPMAFRLDPAQPNPWSHDVRISFALPRDGAASITLFDVSGRRLRRWSWSELSAGSHDVRWDGRTDDGRMTRAGVLFCRLEASGRTLQRVIVHAP